MIPSKNDLNILFAHVAYQLAPRFELRKTGIKHAQAWNRDELDRQIADADVLVISGLWRNELLPAATKLRFIQVQMMLDIGYSRCPACKTKSCCKKESAYRNACSA